MCLEEIIRTRIAEETMKAELDEYRKKRDFNRTEEPDGHEPSSDNEAPSELQAGAVKKGETAPRRGTRAKNKKKLIFAVQYHLARREHYDFRLEWDGVLLSWAVPKGPSYNPADKRLAVMVEAHPVDYAGFEGTIPKGEYGGGTVMLWDEGTWEPQGDVEEGLEKGSLKFTLTGRRLSGKWTLVRFKGERNEEKNWLLIKEKDGLEKRVSGIKGYATGVRSGRSVKEINKQDDKTLKINPMSETDVQLAKLIDKVPKEAGWLYEVKYDGYRMTAFTERGKTRLKSRNGKDFTDRFKTVAAALTNFAAGRAAVLDGEAVIANEDGKTDFQALQSYVRKPDGKMPVYMVFDILALDGEDLRGLELLKRKEILRDFLKGAPINLAYSNYVEGEGEKCFEAARRSGLEGIVGKREASPYSAGRNGDWIKLKCYNRQEFIVAGFTRSAKKEDGISSLLLGLYADGKLIYAGRAGTGIGEEEAKQLEKAFKNLKRKEAPFERMPKVRTGEKVLWLKPELVAEIQFAEWTDCNVLRQASYKGLRLDKDAKAVVAERLAIDVENPAEENASVKRRVSVKKTVGKSEKGLKAEQSADARVKEAAGASGAADDATSGKNRTRKSGSGSTPQSGAYKKEIKDEDGTYVCGVKISNPDKTVYSDPEIKKIDVVRYYELAAKRMLEYSGGRVLSVVRCHKGVTGECFFKKHPLNESEGTKVVEVTNSDGETSDYFYIENARGLIGEAQLGSIEFHIWGSRAENLDKPDMMVFDLDPDEGMDIARVREGVRDLKKLLDELSLKAYLKTSGGKGYHVVVPFTPSADWKAFHDFARHVAQLMETRWPDKYTSNVRKNKRKGKIFIDWARNGRGSTSVAPYSLRARPGAKVSMPIAWTELDKVAPDGVDMYGALERLKKRDPWKDFFKSAQRLKF